ncbi:hypothetical protein ACA910_018711 [Epithemia clementina (nom. ined.)]
MMTTSSSAGGNGRVAIVTGANKGIGYFIALDLALSGLFQYIVLGCRDAVRASEAVKSIQAKLAENVNDNCKAVQVSSESLTLGDVESHKAFVAKMEATFGKADVLVNNAAMAFKNADPTPFAQQTKPTLDVNYRGTVDLTERLVPLLKKGTDPRIVSVASMAGRLGQVSPALQAKFTDPNLTMEQLNDLVNQFEESAQKGTLQADGWGRSNYGMSKLAVIAATKVWARQYASDGIFVNCCCPGACRTDMSSQSGSRTAAEGARNAVIPATMENPPTGEYFADFQVAQW